MALRPFYRGLMVRRNIKSASQGVKQSAAPIRGTPSSIRALRTAAGSGAQARHIGLTDLALNRIHGFRRPAARASTIGVLVPGPVQAVDPAEAVPDSCHYKEKQKEFG